MYVLLVILFAAAGSVAFWMDSQISHSPLQFWWLAIVAAYLLNCLDIALRDLGPRVRLLLAACSGLLILVCIHLFDDLLTAYLCATALVVSNLAGWHLETVQGAKQNRVTSVVLAMLVIALVLLPLSINRVEVRLPNLSAGTSLTLVTDSDERPSLDAEFVNRTDDHLPLTTYLGTQIYPGEGQSAPRLRIDIIRDFIVVRIISIRFQSHIGFIDTTLFGAELERLIETNKDAGYAMEMEGESLLITGLEVGQPAMIQLPAVDTYRFSLKERILSTVIRLLLLALIWYAVLAWAPRHRSGETRSGATRTGVPA